MEETERKMMTMVEMTIVEMMKGRRMTTQCNECYVKKSQF